MSFGNQTGIWTVQLITWQAKLVVPRWWQSKRAKEKIHLFTFSLGNVFGWLRLIQLQNLCVESNVEFLKKKNWHESLDLLWWGKVGGGVEGIVHLAACHQGLQKFREHGVDMTSEFKLTKSWQIYSYRLPKRPKYRTRLERDSGFEHQRGIVL